MKYLMIDMKYLMIHGRQRPLKSTGSMAFSAFIGVSAREMIVNCIFKGNSGRVRMSIYPLAYQAFA